MRPIDADALIAKCGNWYTEEGTEEGFIGAIKQLLYEQPTIEPVKRRMYQIGYKDGQLAERKKGRWIYGESEEGNDGYYCSECGNFVPWIYKEYDINFIKEFLYCNKCGADMRGEKDGTD